MSQSSPPPNKPLPNKALDSLDLEAKTLRAGTDFYRIHSEEHSPFYYFRDPPEYRFDDPNSEYGALYLSLTQVGAFAETISRAYFAQALTAPRIIFLSHYSGKSLTRLKSTRTMTAMDLTNNANAFNIGVGAELMSDDDYSWTQQWSRGFYKHPANFDGIYYQAKHAPSTRSIAVFERFPEDDFEQIDSTPLTRSKLPNEILEYIDKAGFGIVE